jgi:predicted  nucleic acid-binding Zn-ribbon protein
MTNVLKYKATSLQDHLVDCEERYQGVENKIDAMTQRLDRIELLLLDIKSVVSSFSNKNLK